MAVTKEQAMTEREFYINTSQFPVRQSKVDCWRANGKCQTWKTRPEEFKLPIKFGLYSYGYLTNNNAHLFYLTKEEAING